MGEAGAAEMLPGEAAAAESGALWPVEDRDVVVLSGDVQDSICNTCVIYRYII